MEKESKSAHPYYRHLRGYALDPGFSTQLSTMTINEVNYKVLWESLDPGLVRRGNPMVHQ